MNRLSVSLILLAHIVITLCAPTLLQPGTILNNRYRIRHKLNDGTYGIVYAAYDEQNRQASVAVKVFDGPKPMEEATKEMNAFAASLCRGHKGVVQPIDEFSIPTRMQQQQYYAIVYELMTCDLFDIVQDDHERLFNKYNERIPNPDIFDDEDKTPVLGIIHRVVTDIVPVLQYLEHRNITHADVKPANILLDSVTKRFKLHDFGLTRPSGEYDQLAGTVGFMSPELFLQGRFSAASDMWALGVTLLEAYTRVSVFEVSAYAETPKYLNLPMEWYRVLGRMPPRMEAAFIRLKFHIPHTRSSSKPTLLQMIRQSDALFGDFIGRALHYDYTKRMTFDEALRHPFITQSVDRLAEEFKRLSL